VNLQLGDTKSRTPRWFGWITAAVVVVIIYGSLYPFSFRDKPGSPLADLTATFGQPDGRGDILANILFYFPLGFFAIQMLRRRAAGAVAVVTLAGMVLSTCMEVLQFYVPGRDQAISDICSNTAGSFVGAVTGTVLFGRSHLDILQPIRKHPSTVLLLGCWLAYRLYPYVPDIDLHKYWHAVRPLLVSPALPPLDLARHTVIWLILSVLVTELFDTAWRHFAFPVFVVLVLGARIAIHDAILSPAEVAGAAIAVLCNFGRLQRRLIQIRVIFGLAVIFVVLEALEPYRFVLPPRPFHWVPFQGFLHGSLAVNAQVFLEKSFLYGNLVWLATRAGWPWRFAVPACGALISALRLIQVYIPGRSAEISDVVILCMMSGMIWVLDQEPHDAVRGVTEEDRQPARGRHR